MKLSVFALVIIFGAYESTIRVDAFEKNDFKSTMTTCFETWNSQRSETDVGKYMAIIRSILKSTIGAESPKIFKSTTQEKELADFIYNNYEKVSYHNICHGIMVSYYTYLMMNDIKTANANPNLPGTPATDAEIKAAVFAGLLHDIGHPGVGNKRCSDQGVTDGLHKRFCIFKANANNNACVPNSEDTTIFQGLISNDKFYNLFATDSNTLKAKALGIMNLITSNFDSQNSKNFFTLFCNTEELMHALITNELLVMVKDETGVSVDSDFINMAVLSILGTNMGLYEFGGATNYKPKTTFKYHYFHVVHIADLVGVGESDESLRRSMLKKVSREFLVEKKITNDVLFTTWYSSLEEFLKSQAGFVGGFIVPWKTTLLPADKQSSATATTLIDNASGFKYPDLFAQVKKPENEHTVLFKKFKSDFADILAEGPLRVI